MPKVVDISTRFSFENQRREELGSSSITNFPKQLTSTLGDIKKRYQNILEGHVGMLMHTSNKQIESFYHDMTVLALGLEKPIEKKEIFEKLVLHVLGVEDFCNYFKIHYKEFTHINHRNIVIILQNILPKLAKKIIFEEVSKKGIKLRNNDTMQYEICGGELENILEKRAFQVIDEVTASMLIEYPNLENLDTQMRKEFSPKMHCYIAGIVACYEYFEQTNVISNFSQTDFLDIANNLLRDYKKHIVDEMLEIIQNLPSQK